MRKKRVSKIPRSVLAVFEPPTDLTVSEWADKHRILPPGYPTPEHGAWRTDRTPYLRKIQDTLNDPYLEKIVLCKASQLGGTEALYNMILYSLSEKPQPVMLIMPTEALAVSISKNRIQPSINSCEKLAGSKSSNLDDFSLMEMKFRETTLTLVGSNSPANLASRPVCYLFLDETDKFPSFVGKEADPISLATERQKTFWNKKVVIISTPTLETGYIWQQLSSCDAIYDYHVPCPHCGVYQVLKFEGIKWEKFLNPGDKERADYFGIVRNISVYECESCKEFITNIQRPGMLGAGEWKPRGEVTERARSVGFHLPSFYSPWLTWGDMAEKFLASKDYPDIFQNVVNSWWALPWVKKILYKEEHEYLTHRVDSPMLIVPDDTVALTAGVDPGQGGFWFVILAWNRFESVHLVNYGFLTSWENVKTFLIQGKDPKTGEPFYRSAKGIPWYIYRTGVDTGGSEYDESETTMTEDAYNFLKQFGKNINVIGTKGRGGFATGQKMKEAPDNIKVGNLIKTREFSLWLIDSGGFKDLLHYKLQIKIGEPGSFTMNSEVKNDFIKHLMAQEKRRNKKGIYEWMQVYKDDHLLDCTVIALACGDAECWTGVRGFRERGGDNPEPPSPQPIQPKDHPFYGSSRVTKVEEKKSLNRQPGWKWGR